MSFGGVHHVNEPVSQNQGPRSQHRHLPSLGQPLPNLEPREGCAEQGPALPSSGSAAEMTGVWAEEPGPGSSSLHAPPPLWAELASIEHSGR